MRANLGCLGFEKELRECLIGDGFIFSRDRHFTFINANSGDWPQVELESISTRYAVGNLTAHGKSICNKTQTRKPL
jgi:hypothetical protein